MFDLIGGRLASPELRPRAILDRANVEAIATTEFALDPLESHRRLAREGWIGRVRTTYRPDDVTDPAAPGFVENVRRLGELTGEDTASWSGPHRGAPQAPRLLPRARRRRHRPRHAECR